MKNWKTAALAAALGAAAGLGAALAPVAHGQSARVVTPGNVEVITLSAGSRLGVSVRDVAAEDVKSGQPAGVLITEVTDGSAAEKGGLRAGDVVVEFDGERVRSVRQFTRLVQESVAGRPVAMTVLREGQRQNLTVSPEGTDAFRRLREEVEGMTESLRAYRVIPPRPPAPPSPPPAPRTPREFPDFETFIWRGTTTLGMTINDLTPQLAEYFGVKEGVLVASVAEGTAAARAGLRAGDIVTAFNGARVARPAELRREIQRVGAGQAFTVDVVREKKPLTLKGQTDERRDQRRSSIVL
jgi:serine protease Do